MSFISLQFQTIIIETAMQKAAYILSLFSIYDHFTDKNHVNHSKIQYKGLFKINDLMITTDLSRKIYLNNCCKSLLFSEPFAKVHLKFQTTRGFFCI